MNWTGFGRKQLWPISRYYPGIRQEGLRKNIKTSVTIGGLQAEILTRDLLNTKQEC
jgi:hypothetical protein